MRLLVVTPDYASHWFPLSAVAAAARARGADVVVATGPALRARVEADGFRWLSLRMSRGSNAGIAGRDDPDDDLRAFFAATRRGMVATLRQQADARGDDLLWEPSRVAGDVLRLLDEVRPDAVVVDHLAFSTTLALRAAGRPFTTFVPGHPTQLPVAGEVYGFPTAWPAAVDASVDGEALRALRARCEDVRDAFTERYNRALRVLSRDAEPVPDAFRGPRHRRALQQSRRPAPAGARPAPCPTATPSSGAASATRRPMPSRRRGSPAVPPEPFVYVSFGTFLSARDDVLHRVVTGLRTLGVDVAMATGSADPGVLGALLQPGSWRRACPGHARPSSDGGRHARRQQHRHRDPRRRCTHGRAAVLHRPVRHRRRPRADRPRHRPRSQRGDGRRRGRGVGRDHLVRAGRARRDDGPAVRDHPGPDVAADRLGGTGAAERDGRIAGCEW